MTVRQFLGSEEVHKGDDLTFSWDVSNLASSPTISSFAAYDITAGEGSYTLVTSTVISGSGSVSGTTITTPVIVGSAMTVGNIYRIIGIISDGGSQNFALYTDHKCIGETVAA